MLAEATAVRRHGPRVRLSAWITWPLFVLAACLWLLPFWSLITAAMKSAPEYARSSVWALPGHPLTLFHNMQVAWQTGGLGPGFLASLFYGIVGAALAIVVASLGAYALTHLRIPAAFLWFMVVFSGTIFPFQMYLIPLFQAYTAVGLYDTRLGMVLFYTAIAIPFCLFVMRGFFSTVPGELQEAARLDGARDFGVYWRIFMPLARGPIAVLFLFQFTWIWNDLLFGLVLSRSDGVRPIMPSLVGMQGLYSQIGPTTPLAGALLVSLPTIALFLLLRRYMIKGLTLTVGAD
jgi:ABC-type glycerol-3-phosphate transport system permease component